MDGIPVSPQTRQTTLLRERFYAHWMLSCAPLALATGAFLWSAAGRLPFPLIVIWLQFVVYLVHETEEHVLPGGFKDYLNDRIAKPRLARRFPGRTIPEGDFPLDDRAVFWINISFIWVLFPVAAVLAGQVSLAFGLAAVWLSIVNACLHLAFAAIERGYNPGLGTSLLLNLPAGIWAVVVLSVSGVGIDLQIAGAAFGIAAHAGLAGWMLSSALRRTASR